MPTYEYECEAGHLFEVEQSIKDAPLKECPMWHNPLEPRMCKKKCKRLISATSFVLKGDGWAKDGYK